MIVVGVDPGSRDTGIAVVEVRATAAYSRPILLAATTVHRAKVDGEDLLDVPAAYLRDVNAAIADAVAGVDPAKSLRPELIAVETVKRPSWRVAGKVKPLDPVGIMATSIVLGAILGRAWTVPVVRIPPGDNGKLLPLTAYPVPLATKGKGTDKRRHERAAYDVASQGPAIHRLTRGGIQL